MKGDPDIELVEGCLSGDLDIRERSFALIFEKYKDKVYNTAFRITGDAALANDASQEAFLSVYKNLRSFQFEAKFSSWLYRIAVNFSIDRKRKASKEPPIISEDVGNPDKQEWDIVDAKSVDPEQLARTKEFEARVQGVVDRISAPLRVVVVLRFMSGLSYKEIASTLGCSVGTVKSRLSRAMRTLEPLLFPILSKDRDGKAPQ